MYVSRWADENGIGLAAAFARSSDSGFKRDGLVVTNVEPDSAADRAGIQVGFLLRSIKMNPFGGGNKVKWAEGSLDQLDSCVPDVLIGIQVNIPNGKSLTPKAQSRRKFIEKRKVSMVIC